MKRSLKNKSGMVGIRKGISENNTDKLVSNSTHSLEQKNNNN